jgi:hypothetical protein
MERQTLSRIHNLLSFITLTLTFWLVRGFMALVRRIDKKPIVYKNEQQDKEQNDKNMVRTY